MWPSLFGLILFQVNSVQADGVMASDRPVTTRCFVGNTGAGVPDPCTAKRAKESTSTGSPAQIRRPPSAVKLVGDLAGESPASAISQLAL